MNTKIKTAVLAVAVAGLFAAQSAAADTLTFGGFSNGSVAATVYNTPTAPVGGNPTSVSAGGFNMTNTTAGGTFQAWCVDIFSWLSSPTSYTNVSGAGFYGTTTTGVRQVSDLEALATRYLPSVTGNATNSAAFQLAVWEIVNESSGTYNIASGSFHATSAAAATAATMLSGLTLATTNTAQILSVWKETGSPTQDLAVFAPVPEPDTYAMMLAGLGLIGFIVRQRKKEEVV